MQIIKAHETTRTNGLEHDNAQHHRTWDAEKPAKQAWKVMAGQSRQERGDIARKTKQISNGAPAYNKAAQKPNCEGFCQGVGGWCNH